MKIGVFAALFGAASARYYGPDEYNPYANATGPVAMTRVPDTDPEMYDDSDDDDESYGPMFNKTMGCPDPMQNSWDRTDKKPMGCRVYMNSSPCNKYELDM